MFTSAAFLFKKEKEEVWKNNVWSKQVENCEQHAQQSWAMWSGLDMQGAETQRDNSAKGHSGVPHFSPISLHQHSSATANTCNSQKRHATCLCVLMFDIYHAARSIILKQLWMYFWFFVKDLAKTIRPLQWVLTLTHYHELLPSARCVRTSFSLHSCQSFSNEVLRYAFLRSGAPADLAMSSASCQNTQRKPSSRSTPRRQGRKDHSSDSMLLKRPSDSSESPLRMLRHS